MTDIYLDPTTHDLSLDNGLLRLTSDRGELARQRAEIRLQTYRGEWFANVLLGVPYLKNKNNKINILGLADRNTADFYIKEAILDDELVSKIVRYDSSYDPFEKTLTVSFEAILYSGETIGVDSFTLA